METWSGFIRETVSNKVSLLATDDAGGYRHVGKQFPHGVVRHSVGEYVVGSIHTQTIDSFWSLLKRGVMGTFHKVSAKYMPLYVAELYTGYFWCGDSRLLRRGHWHPSQLERNDASEPKEPEQLELFAPWDG